MKKYTSFLISVFTFMSLWAQDRKPQHDENNGLFFYIGSEVKNADDTDEKQIINLWKDYLLDGRFRDPNSTYWSFENMQKPDEYLWAVGIESLQNRGYKVQCKIIGIFPVENKHYCLKSAFMHTDTTGEIHLDVITTVYAKKVNGEYKLVNSAEYYQGVLEHHQVGNIHYYTHPFHTFNKSEADKMNAFNLFMAKEFNTEPISFRYYVANTSRDITEIWGYEYLNKMYQPDQTGGVASFSNKLIYSGNNSEYYPHELVHLYTSKIVPKRTHFWIGEGIATFYGGSGGYPLEWHLLKLKTFLDENPDYDLSDIDKLAQSIPNDDHNTDFRYVIGGYLMRKIYDQYGVAGFLEALEIEGGSVKEAFKTGSNHNFFTFLKEKLNVDQNSFDSWIKTEMKNLIINKEKLEFK